MSDAIVLLSGGIDSATALAMTRATGRRCHALSFRYGQRHAVELTAAQAVARALGADGLRVIDIDLRGLGGSALTDDIAVPKGRSESDIGAGIPLFESLNALIEQVEKEQVKRALTEVREQVREGISFAKALEAHPTIFPPLYINMVRAGEASGSLAQIFDRLAEFERTRDDLRGYIVSSLIYPILLTLVGLGSIFVLLNFVVPRFALIFSDPRMKIPTPTAILLEVSALVQAYWLPTALALFVAVVLFQVYIRTQPGRLWWDTIRLKMPLLGDALRKAETARFARAMGTLVAASVPLVQSIGIARGILNNRRMAGTLEQVAQGVKRGEGIAGPLTRTAQFPPLAGHLLMVGEETGHLDTMFNRMADIYDGETRTAIRRFTALFEPLIILVMGLVVGSLIMSLMLAITSINDIAI